MCMLPDRDGFLEWVGVGATEGKLWTIHAVVVGKGRDGGHGERLLRSTGGPAGAISQG